MRFLSEFLDCIWGHTKFLSEKLVQLRKNKRNEAKFCLRVFYMTIESFTLYYRMSPSLILVTLVSKRQPSLEQFLNLVLPPDAHINCVAAYKVRHNWLQELFVHDSRS